MNIQKKKLLGIQRRAHRTRTRIGGGTAERPRLSVLRSLQHISVQLIDDVAGRTLAYADDRDGTGNKKERATSVGKKIAEAAAAKGITTVVFDRGSYRFHGRVKAVADAAREAGLKF